METAKKRRAVRAIILTLAGLIALALAAQALEHGLILLRRLPNEWNNTFGEAAKIERALAVARGEALHPLETAWPMRSAGYGELYYYLPGWIARGVGLEGSRWDQARTVMIVGRLMVFSAMIACLVWLWFAAETLKMERRWRVVGLLLFFSSLGVIRYADCYRADFPMAACALWAWLTAARGKGGPSAVGAGVLMGFAFLFKQPALAPMAALALLLACRREWLRLALYGVAALGLVALVSGALALVFGEQGAASKSPVERSLATVLFGFLRSPDLKWTNPWTNTVLLFRPPVLAMPMIAGAAGTLWFLRRRDVARWPLFAFVWTFLAAHAASLHRGSYLNYYVDTYCWAVLIATLAAREAMRRLTAADWFGWAPRPGWTVLLLVLFVLYGFRGERAREDLPRQLRGRPSALEENRALIERLRRVEGELLTSHGMLWFHTQSPPTYMYAPMYYDEARAWGEGREPVVDELVAKIEDHDFEAVVLARDLERLPADEAVPYYWPPAVVRALKRNYRETGDYPPFKFYEPKE